MLSIEYYLRGNIKIPIDSSNLCRSSAQIGAVKDFLPACSDWTCWNLIPKQL